MLEKLQYLPLKLGLSLVHNSLKRGDILVSDFAALLERLGAQGFEFFLHPADASADDHAPAGQNIEAREHLRRNDGIAIRQDHDTGDKANAIGRAGEKPHGHQSFQVISRARIFAVGRIRIRHRDVARNDDVVRDGDAVKSQRLGAAGRSG